MNCILLIFLSIIFLTSASYDDYYEEKCNAQLERVRKCDMPNSSSYNVYKNRTTFELVRPKIQKALECWGDVTCHPFFVNKFYRELVFDMEKLVSDHLYECVGNGALYDAKQYCHHPGEQCEEPHGKCIYNRLLGSPNCQEKHYEHLKKFFNLSSEYCLIQEKARRRFDLNF